MPRKTIPVESVKAAANAILANSIPEQKEGRIGAYMLLENILFATDNYHGYRHIDGENGQKDDTRRMYY